MAKYRVKARHEVYCDYLVEAGSADEAIATLCRIEEPWTSYSGGEVFGADDALLARHGVEVDLEDSWVSGVCALRQQTHTYPDWEVTEEWSDD